MAKMDKEASDYGGRWITKYSNTVKKRGGIQKIALKLFRVALESDFVAEIRKEEIAVCQDEANQQHYEVKTFHSN